MGRHHWWHLRSTYTKVGDRLIARCCTCSAVLADVEDDGYRCEVCGSAFCDPMEHH